MWNISFKTIKRFYVQFLKYVFIFLRYKFTPFLFLVGIICGAGSSADPYSTRQNARNISRNAFINCSSNNAYIAMKLKMQAIWPNRGCPGILDISFFNATVHTITGYNTVHSSYIDYVVYGNIKKRNLTHYNTS